MTLESANAKKGATFKGVASGGESSGASSRQIAPMSNKRSAGKSWNQPSYKGASKAQLVQAYASIGKLITGSSQQN
jgi:hypothetical protein